MPRLKRFLSEVKDGVPQTLLLHTTVGNTQEAKKELLEFSEFEETENVLNSVKPTRLLRHLLKIGTSPTTNDIVLDFFAGSGPSAHAAILQNLDDGGNRKFIMVQIPESLPKEEAAAKTIADLAKSRIRNVIQKIVDDQTEKTKKDECELSGMTEGVQEIDLGFKVFKLDSSNIRAWNPDRDDLEQTLIDHMKHLVEGRSKQDVLYELLLKRGVDLPFPLKKEL